MSATPAIQTTPTEAPDAAPGRWSLWSDRLNPILVREVMQAVKGRAFTLTVLAALGISVLIAIGVVRRGDVDESSGRDAFSAGLATLAPLLLFVVPMQAYQSMRLELRGGIVEQLFLSRLRPRAIVLGKLLAALVQFVLYVSVLAPLLATSYLLRGVDLPTIALSLLFALVFNLAATAAAISAAAQGIVPAMQPIANVGVAFGLGMGTFFLMALVGSGEYLRDIGWLMRSPEFGMVTSLFVTGALCGTVLSGLTAQGFLMHAFENRSTPFRVFLVAMVGVAFGWMLLFVDRAQWPVVTSGLLIFLVLLGTVFAIFMVTEQRDLSPRVRAHAPRSGLLALLAAPFLPGRDRGIAMFLLYLGLLGAIAAVSWPWIASPVPGFASQAARLPVFIAAYALVWLSFGKALRAWLPPAVVGNHLARFLLPLSFLLALLLPVLFDIFVRGQVGSWHIGHVLNPFWTIDRFAFSDGHPRAFSAAAAVCAVFAVLQLLACVRGCREVLAASAARRAAVTAEERA